MAVILPLLAGLIGAGVGTYQGITASNAQESIDNFHNTMSNNDYFNGQSVTQIINDLSKFGYIDTDTYKAAIKQAQTYEDNRDADDWYGFMDYTFNHFGPTNTKTAKLYDALTEGINKLTADLDERYEKFDPEELQASLSKPAYTVPGYSAVATVNPNANEIPVDPMYRYTNQELADLYGINYDTNYYYDLIKQGTQANINYKDYVNEQAWNAAQHDNTVRQNNYLSTLRDAKSQAVINGATLGAQAANELLANTSAANEYNALMTDTANKAVENITPAYLEASNAMLDARQYHDMTLGKNLANVLESLYFNESNRYGADVNLNANIYKANQEYNAAAAQANASMYAQQAQANATAYTYQNQYKWMFNVFYNAASGTPKQKYATALSDMEQYINHVETKYNNVSDMLNAAK